jgi:hypothetical protein
LDQLNDHLNMTLLTYRGFFLAARAKHMDFFLSYYNAQCLTLGGLSGAQGTAGAQIHKSNIGCPSRDQRLAQIL